MALFGARLLIPMEPWFGDISDFPPTVLNEFTTQSDMVLRGIPNFHGSYYWSHNPTLWAKGGGDPNNIPTTWDELIALAPEFLAKGVKPSVQPWLGTDGGFATFYFKQMYNSFNVPFLSADRTQALFGGPEGMAVFTTISNGLKNGYWDNTTLNIGNEHDAFTLFAQGKYAAIVDGTDNPKTGLNSSNYVVGVMPGMKAGTTGSVNGDDGLGISKFSAQQDASKSFLQTMYSIPVAKQIAVATPEIYGSPRISLQNYPPLVAIETNPTAQVIAAQSAGPSSLWSAPYNYAPVFDDVMSKLVKGTYSSPQQALDAAVKGVQGLIITYLSA
ncbi:MAG TPA: extracellular solute-binding protein, partial [Candidatus Saccharimonadales bacterium]|nr:extracellular solute-binding protein [Candidatus Saccharimonadales bacterium]